MGACIPRGRGAASCSPHPSTYDAARKNKIHEKCFSHIRASQKKNKPPKIKTGLPSVMAAATRKPTPIQKRITAGSACKHPIFQAGFSSGGPLPRRQGASGAFLGRVSRRSWGYNTDSREESNKKRPTCFRAGRSACVSRLRLAAHPNDNAPERKKQAYSSSYCSIPSRMHQRSYFVVLRPLRFSINRCCARRISPFTSSDAPR